MASQVLVDKENVAGIKLPSSTSSLVCTTRVELGISEPSRNLAKAGMCGWFKPANAADTTETFAFRIY
jgi:hypothetical protein